MKPVRWHFPGLGDPIAEIPTRSGPPLFVAPRGTSITLYGATPGGTFISTLDPEHVQQLVVALNRLLDERILNREPDMPR